MLTLTTSTVVATLCPMPAPKILQLSVALRRWSERTVLLDDADEPVLIEALPTFARLIRSAWDAPPSTADVARTASRMSDQGVCRTCGGAHVVPTWVGEFLRYGQPSMPTYGTPPGMQPMACPTSRVAANVGTWSPPGIDQTECALCSGTGLLPEWAAMAIEEGDHEPRWLGGRHLEGRYWFASYCRACAGWGYIKKGDVTDVVHATLPSASPETPPQATAAAPWFWHADPRGGWRVRFGGKETQLPKHGGFARIAELLNNPGRPYPVTSWSPDQRGSVADPGVDPKSLTAVRNELEELDERIKIERDLARREDLEHTRAHLHDYLLKNSGLGGKPRTRNKAYKNAYDRERNAINRAIENLRDLDWPDLAAYLRDTIKCGSDLLFEPKAGETWDVKQG